MKSDGNGGVIINKGMFALIMCLIALLSVIATVVAFGVNLKSDVAFLKAEYEEAGPRHSATIDSINDHVQDNAFAITLNTERVTRMQSDLAEIKNDVKELLKK